MFRSRVFYTLNERERKSMSKRKPQDLRLARNIAKNLVLKRVKDGLNQTKVAEALNVTFQQEQKFEGGNNCMRADQLFLICRKFGWDIRDFEKEPLNQNGSTFNVKATFGPANELKELLDETGGKKIIRDFDFTNSLMKKIHKAFDRIDNRSRISIAEERKDAIYPS